MILKNMKTIDIIGKNYSGEWTNSRKACRGIVLRDESVLLSYETLTGQWMLPGGGAEAGEDDISCCIREVAEETGILIQPSECVLEIDEYYENMKYESRYFFGRIVGKTKTNLTDREKEVGMVPRFLPVTEIMDIFAQHDSYAQTDEMRRGMYFREYTALHELLGNHLLYLRQRKLLDQFLATGAISQAQHDKSLYDLTEKMGETEFVERFI